MSFSAGALAGADRQRHLEIKLKSRKRGTTTGCCFLCLDNIAYRKNTEAVTMAHEEKMAGRIARCVQARAPRGLLRRAADSSG